MVHSGCNGGKLWRIQVYEKMGPCEVKLFDTKVEAERLWGKQSEDCTRGIRPLRAVELLEDWLFVKPTFDYESHAVYVNSKWFSLHSVAQGLQKIGEFFNQPLVFEKKGEEK
jgi:hypothetical protein